MSKFVKFSSQVPSVLQEWFSELDHGHKQLACTGALIWYFNSDEETQRLFRAWAQGLAEGYATLEEPPEMVKSAIEKCAASFRTGRGRSSRRKE